MWKVETKVARWRALYGELCAAEQRLRQARAGRRNMDEATSQLHEEVTQLQQRCDAALEEVGAALAARRTPGTSGGPASSPPS